MNAWMYARMIAMYGSCVCECYLFIMKSSINNLNNNTYSMQFCNIADHRIDCGIVDWKTVAISAILSISKLIEKPQQLSCATLLEKVVFNYIYLLKTTHSPNTGEIQIYRKKPPQRILGDPCRPRQVLIIRIWLDFMKTTCRLGFCLVSTFNGWHVSKAGQQKQWSDATKR